MASTVPGFLALTIFTAILGMFQFGFNTGVVNVPQVSFCAKKIIEKIHEILIFRLKLKLSLETSTNPDTKLKSRNP